MHTAQDFAYWLQGFVELQDSDSISDKQWLMIKDHLKLVFNKKTPDRYESKVGGPDSAPFDYDRIYDLIGKEVTWPASPYTATC